MFRNGRQWQLFLEALGAFTGLGVRAVGRSREGSRSTRVTLDLAEKDPLSEDERINLRVLGRYGCREGGSGKAPRGAQVKVSPPTTGFLVPAL